MSYPYIQEDHDKAAAIGCLVCIIACVVTVTILLGLIFSSLQSGEISYITTSHDSRYELVVNDTHAPEKILPAGKDYMFNYNTGMQTDEVHY